MCNTDRRSIAGSTTVINQRFRHRLIYVAGYMGRAIGAHVRFSSPAQFHVQIQALKINPEAGLQTVSGVQSTSSNQASNATRSLWSSAGRQRPVKISSQFKIHLTTTSARRGRRTPYISLIGRVSVVSREPARPALCAGPSPSPSPCRLSQTTLATASNIKYDICTARNRQSYQRPRRQQLLDLQRHFTRWNRINVYRGSNLLYSTYSANSGRKLTAI